MQPMPKTAFVIPIARPTQSALVAIESSMPALFLGIVEAIDPQNKSGIAVGDKVAYTAAAMTTFEAEDRIYHVVPESQIVGIIEESE